MLFLLPIFEVGSGYYGNPSLLESGGLQILHEIALISGYNSLSFGKALHVKYLIQLINIYYK